VKVIVVNHDRERTVQLRRLDRVAQLVVQRVEQVGWREVDELRATTRGSGGHGSTGGYEREG
jgi:dUTP pyrophosphatase